MPFIPLHDENPRVSTAWPYVTWGLMLACAVMYLVQSLAGNSLIVGLGLTPATLTGATELDPHLHPVAPLVTLVTYGFLHGNALHLGGNLLFLGIFGDKVEDAMGHGRFLLFYLLGGALAGLAQTAVDPLAGLPTIGASGAVAALLGAYLMLRPRAKILIPIAIFPLYLPAVLLLVFWILVQLYIAAGDGAALVAWWAHIGGFIAGALLIIPLRRNSLPLLDGDNLPSGQGTWG